MQRIDRLEQKLGKGDAEKITQLMNDYNKYVSKFKKEINSIVNPKGYEIRVGAMFFELEREITDGSKN